MIPVKNIRFARTADIPAGNLVALHRGQRPELGLNIAETKDGPRGVLWFYIPRKAIEFEQIVNKRCFDLGKPIFNWIPSAHDFHFGPDRRLMPGQLIVLGESVLIAGVEGSVAPRSPAAWNVYTGERASLDRIADAALLHQWKLGLNVANGSFIELLEAPTGRSYFD